MWLQGLAKNDVLKVSKVTVVAGQGQEDVLNTSVKGAGGSCGFTTRPAGQNGGWPRYKRQGREGYSC